MIYIVNFYDHNECGNMVHNEVYTTYKAALRRFNMLKNKLNCYSWVKLSDTLSKFGRIFSNICLEDCPSCYGDDDYYHGDDCDF